MNNIRKTVLIALGVVLLIIPFRALASDDKPVSFKELPQKAQSFIIKYFSPNDILMAKFDNELLGGTYEVKFKNGGELDFDKKGEWKEINCGVGEVPSGLIHPKILGKVKELYPNASITEVKKDKVYTEIKLSNGKELKFDKVIKLVEVDD